MSCQGQKMNVNEEGLRDWFGKSKSKDGKKGWVNVVTGGTCASDKPGEGTPKCVSSAKRASMTKAERLSAQRRKKKADPGQQQKTGAAKPTYVSTDPKKKMKEGVEVTEAKDKKGKGSGTKDACYHKVKSRYSVWPSAYASGALVKCRKVGAANWGNSTKKEEYMALPEMTDVQINALRKAGIEVEVIDEKCWKGYEKKGMKTMFGKRYPNCVKKEETEVAEKLDIDKAIKKPGALKKQLGVPEDEKIPADKLAAAAKKGGKLGQRARFAQTLRGFNEGDGDPCWDTHKQVGMKKKGGKMVPNCVPKEETEVAEGKYSSGSVTYVKGTAPVRATYGGKTETFPKETYKKRGMVKTAEEAEVRYCPKCDKNETREECSYGGKYWDENSMPAKGIDSREVKTMVNLAKNKMRALGMKEETVELTDSYGDTFATIETEAKVDESKKEIEIDTYDIESMTEAVRIPSKTGHIIMVNLGWKGKYYSIKMFFPQVGKPSRKDVQDQIEKIYPGGKLYTFVVSNYEPGEPMLHAEGAAWTKKEGKNKSGGLNEKGRKSYERENPGSDLKAPSKKVGNPRRASFCARMKGMKKKLTSSKTANDPDSRINKSLRAWNCSYEPEGNLIDEEGKSVFSTPALDRKKKIKDYLKNTDKVLRPQQTTVQLDKAHFEPEGEQVSEALPALLAAPAVAKAAGAAMAGLGAAGLLMKSRRQGSQPADYGQERSTTSRGKSTQRPSGKMGAADRQKRQAAADRRAAARERAQERSSSPQVSEPKPQVQPKKDTGGQKVDPRLERAAGQVLDRIRKGQ